MVVILVNCVCLALTDPLDRDCVKAQCQHLTKINSFVLYFFVAEMVVKMVAMGVIGKKSYFAEGWNRLDFLIVVAGYVCHVSFFGEVNLERWRRVSINHHALRAFGYFHVQRYFRDFTLGGH